MRILIPVDGSKYALAAVHFVAARTALVGTDPEIDLLNVQAPVPPRAARQVGKSACAEYYEDEAEKALKPARRALERAGFSPSTRHVVGHAAEQIAKAIEKPKGKKAAAVDLLVMGSHGHGAFMNLITGSVTTGVLARTRTPILILRGATPPAPEEMKVGLAIDGSGYGLAAARYLIRHRDLFGHQPSVQVLHVVPDFLGAVMPDMAGVALPAYTPDEVRAMQDKAYESALAPVRKLFAQAGMAMEEVRMVGNPGDEISAVAKKRKFDLLVMGSHGHGALRQMVMGSVATRVAAHCTTPLLLVRHT